MEKALKKFALLSFLIMLGLNSWSQDKTATGKVVDPSGLPVSKATILAKGTKAGTSTNEMGSFSLSVPSSAKTIVVSSVGFESKEVSIASGMMNIVLEPSSSKLDEVVVVGYGVQKVTKVSGAVSTVKGSDIEKLKPVRAEDATARPGFWCYRDFQRLTRRQTNRPGKGYTFLYWNRSSCGG